jgi:hypothetical protein
MVGMTASTEALITLCFDCPNLNWTLKLQQKLAITIHFLSPISNDNARYRSAEGHVQVSLSLKDHLCRD